MILSVQRNHRKGIKRNIVLLSVTNLSRYDKMLIIIFI